MAEIAGLVASAIAITGAASATLKISKRLIRMAKQLKSAGAEIEVFAHDIRLFGTVISFSLRSLKRYCIKLEPSSKMYKYLEREKLLTRLAKSSQVMQNRINDVWNTTSSIKSKRKLVTHVKWMLKKTDVLALRPEMESLKTIIQLIIGVIAIELGMGQLDGDMPASFKQEKLEDLAELKAQVKVHVRTIELLQESEQRRWDQEMQTADGPRSHRYMPSRFLEMLKDLGTSMVEREQLPAEPICVSPTSSTTTTNASLRRSNHVSATSAYTPSSSPPVTNSQISIPSEGRTRSESTRNTGNPVTLPLRDELHRSTSKQSSATQKEKAIKTPPILRRKQSNIASSSQPEPDSAIGKVKATLPSQIGSTEGPIEQPKTGVLQFVNEKEDSPIISGYMISNWMRVFTEVIPNPRCQHNLITATRAAHLGLAIEPHSSLHASGTPRVVISYPDGHQEKSCGVVTFQWSQVTHSNRPPLDVKCIVFETGIHDFLPGRPFIDEMRRLWGGGEEKS